MSQNGLTIAEAVSEYIVEPSRSQLLKLISAYSTSESANEALYRLTGIRGFFPNPEMLAEFQQGLRQAVLSVDVRQNREWGDFQTPPELAANVCNYLERLGISPQIIIEPTYGAGNFILAALRSFPTAELVYGVEIQAKYQWHCKVAVLAEALRGQRPSAEIELHQDDIFTHPFPQRILKAQNILIIGNPPWVTNAELGGLEAHNLPAKRNIKGLNGLDAVTGKSNFDLGEFVLLRLLDLFSLQPGALAMLCKNSVIKNLIELLPKRRFSVSNIRALEINASREFGVAVAASLLVLEMGAAKSVFTCQVTALDYPDRVLKTFGWVAHRFVANLESYQAHAELDGQSPFMWRQGLKHDCAQIMELNIQDRGYRNGNNEPVDVETEWVYGLLKSSDLRRFEVDRPRKKVIITQHSLGEDTSSLQQQAPKLWRYLLRNSKYFEKRKSSIYRHKPRFSIFGIGDYSFKLYKVAISALYKEPCFSVVLPVDNRPVMLDDTCYFLGFDTYLEALFTASLLNSPLVKQFLESIVFTSAKRPYTKEVLMRIDLTQAVTRLSFHNLSAVWSETNYRPRVSVTEAAFEAYKQQLLSLGQKSQGLQLRLGI